MRAALVAFGALFAVALSTRDAGAQDTTQDDVWRGPVLSPELSSMPTSYWTVSAGLEHFGGGFAGSDYLIAVATTFRHGVLGPNALFMAKPQSETEGYEDARFLFGLGLRAYVPLLGTEVSYGFGSHGELRFEDHFWLVYVTPLELSGIVYRKRTFEIELFVGARHALAGDLINSFLLDPNGFKNEQAQAELDQAVHEDGWRGFVRLVISRRVD